MSVTLLGYTFNSLADARATSADLRIEARLAIQDARSHLEFAQMFAESFPVLANKRMESYKLAMSTVNDIYELVNDLDEALQSYN